MTKLEARAKILEAANKNRLNNPNRKSLQAKASSRPFYARHIQRAAHVARKFNLVSDEVLTAAGFNARKVT